MRYEKLSSALYTRNRKALADRLDFKGLALIFSNDIYPTSADGTLPFVQATDIFYLSGVDQEQTILLLFPDANSDSDKEILFTIETSHELAVWHLSLIHI